MKKLFVLAQGQSSKTGLFWTMVSNAVEVNGIAVAGKERGFLTTTVDPATAFPIGSELPKEALPLVNFPD